MIIYNVTVNIDADVHNDWLQWMKKTHIPDVMATGFFLSNKISKVLTGDEEGGLTYSIMYTCENMEAYERYQAEKAPALQADHTERYAGKFGAFRTLLEVVHQE